MSSKQKLEKQLETALDNLIQKVEDIKSSVINVLLKIEHEDASQNWPSILDSFALLASHFNSLNRYLKNMKGPNLRNFAFLPILLEPEINPNLEGLTEGRVKAFNHEVVPNYMRTKLDPEIEFRDSQTLQRCGQISLEFVQKQSNTMNKISTSVLNHLSNTKENLMSDSNLNYKSNMNNPASVNDFQTLILAVNYGYGLHSSTTAMSSPIK
ncbi:unnamed protein product [Gordionus sp. m RMFG-2023]|uniref:mediator of RNA polymerase II transcription subunit 8-A-like n=1 Tax=Gordionus sp. m RMFG-2023 TaxID=3053472 RepID=UPI0030E0890D